MIQNFHFKQEIWSVPVKSLTDHWNPFQAWQSPPVLSADVQRAIKARRYQRMPWSVTNVMELHEEYAFHVQRIAYLFKHRDCTPISISIGIPSLGAYVDGWFQMDDGNHRLAAAVLRGDSTIHVTYDGQNSLFPVLFPNARICAFKD